MRKDEVEKIEQEIKQKTTLPDNIKGKIKKEIFTNVMISITVMIYFCLLILGSIGTIKNIRAIDFNIFSTLILGFAIYLFEISYRKSDGKLAVFGIEALSIAIFTLFLPYIIFELDEFHKKYYLMVNAYVAIYYITKSIFISLNIKKEYIKEFSDIKDIVKKEKKELYKDTADNIQQQKKEIEKTIIDKKVNNQNKDIEEIKETKTTTKKNVNTKIKVSTEQVVNNKKKTNTSKNNEIINKKKEENTKEKNEKTDVINNIPKKRGRPKKEETLKKETDKKLEEAPKKRGRPKKSEITNNENKSNVEVEPQGDQKPKKRGRPRKVVTSTG